MNVSSLFRLAVRLSFLLALGTGPAAAFVHPAALRSEYDPGAGDGNVAAQIDCLALNVYHEARSEPADGKFAIAMVTLNRVRSPHFPDTVCRVVWQPGQFSWTNDGRPDTPYNAAAWADARWVATLAWWYASYGPPGKAVYYHAIGVHPAWAKYERRLRTVGHHVFYASRN